MPFESFSMGKCLGNSVQFSQGKPFKCNYHSYPSKALKRRTFHKCGHASWYKIISVAVSLCPAAQIRVEIGTYLTLSAEHFQSMTKRGAKTIMTIKTSSCSLLFLYFQRAQKKISHLHPGQDKKSEVYFHQGSQLVHNQPKVGARLAPQCAVGLSQAHWDRFSFSLLAHYKQSWYLSFFTKKVHKFATKVDPSFCKPTETASDSHCWRTTSRADICNFYIFHEKGINLRQKLSCDKQHASRKRTLLAHYNFSHTSDLSFILHRTNTNWNFVCIQSESMKKLGARNLHLLLKNITFGCAGTLFKLEKLHFCSR